MASQRKIHALLSAPSDVCETILPCSPSPVACHPHRFSELRRRCVRARTAYYLRPLLLLARAPLHHRHRMARRCLQEWRDIGALKMELYRKVWGGGLRCVDSGWGYYEDGSRCAGVRYGGCGVGGVRYGGAPLSLLECPGSSHLPSTFLQLYGVMQQLLQKAGSLYSSP